jgi:hypothetical protein
VYSPSKAAQRQWLQNVAGTEGQCSVRENSGPTIKRKQGKQTAAALFNTEQRSETAWQILGSDTRSCAV